MVSLTPLVFLGCVMTLTVNLRVDPGRFIFLADDLVAFFAKPEKPRMYSTGYPRCMALEPLTAHFLCISPIGRKSRVIWAQPRGEGTILSKFTNMSP